MLYIAFVRRPDDHACNRCLNVRFWRPVSLVFHYTVHQRCTSNFTNILFQKQKSFIAENALNLLVKSDDSNFELMNDFYNAVASRILYTNSIYVFEQLYI